MGATAPGWRAAGRSRLRGFRPLRALAAAVAAAGLAIAPPARANVGAADSAAYIAELTAQAESLHLAGDPHWHALLHYRPRRFASGVRSPAQTRDFFFAADGQANPAAELNATLAAFLDDRAVARGGQPPQCAFPARYHWLNARLHFDPARLPARECPRWREWRAAIAPAGLSLIFPEAYMNNPASMFGHTLLRVDMDEPGGGKDLLAYAVNYSAETGRDGGVTFAWKGILGYYPGLFSIRPYYEMVKVYGDWENRDIWEYRLNLPADAIDLLLMHLWELRGVAFFYYFFDDNCSYQLLSLLHVARPDLHLLDRVPTPWVIPVETVRAVVAEAGLVAGVRFRPSSATDLRHAAGALTGPERRLARAVADGAIEPADAALAQLSDRSRAALLGVAYDRLRYRYLSKRVERAESETRSRQILIARSEVAVEGPASPPVPAPAVSPDQGHRTARLALGSGWSNDRFFVEARLRPAFHDLMDPGGGYTAGAQINFLDVAARLYPEERRLRLAEVALLDIVSLSPRDAFFDPISWKLNTGLRSRLLPGAGRSRLFERYVWRTDGGAGLAFEPWSRGLAYGFLEATVDAGSQLDDAVAFGPAATAGLFVGPSSDRWKGHVSASVTRFALGDVDTSVRVSLTQRVTLSAQNALLLSAAYNRSFARDFADGGVSWQWYFD